MPRDCLKTENLVLRSELHELRRTNRFAMNWLKKNHPQVYLDLQLASHQNDERYRTYLIKKMGEGLAP